MGLTRIALVWTRDLPAVEVSREGWVPHVAFWELPAGHLKMWRAEDWGAVRVEHPSGIQAEVDLPVWWGVHSHRPDLEPTVVDGVNTVLDGEPVVIAMPRRGVRRANRTVFITVGPRSYAYAASGLWMSGRSGLVREADGVTIYRRTWPGGDLLLDEASLVEEALAAILDVANVHERVTPWWVKAV